MFSHDVLACASMMRQRSGNIGRLNMGVLYRPACVLCGAVFAPFAMKMMEKAG